jgi:multiple sugar transport system ATP-binding protein
MAVVETKDLVKHFGKVNAVNGVNLEVKEGEFLVILGPSGCGKTTLMRMIAGLEKPTSGRIFIGGQEVTPLPPRDREIAMVFQSYALYPHMTVFENISFPLRARREPHTEIQEKVESAATLLGIQRLLDRRPRQLSGGERQRVALCRALVKEPKVMLLDEPLSNLDAKLRASARDELLRFQRRTGITTIFVTHDQIEAMGMGDRIVVMNAGRVRQIGTPHEIYHNSQDIFVSTFLGSPGMNLIDLGDFQVGFRPEQFVPKQVSDRRNEVREFSFHINRIEYLGADRLLYGQIEGFGEDSLVIARLPEAMDIPIVTDQTYEFGVSKKDLRFFDTETGLRTEPREF